MRLSTRLVTLATALPLLCRPTPATAQTGCAPLPTSLAALVDSAWSIQRSAGTHGTRAESLFARVLRQCPFDAGALDGSGYVRLRAGDLAGARSRFVRALASRPNDYDALTGLGMVAYRTGDRATARQSFEHALLVVPQDSLSRWYLERLPVDSMTGRRLPPVLRPAHTAIAARAGTRVLELPDDRHAGGWRPFWVKGINIGAALPGRSPAEFPDSATYAGWIALAASMNANSLRVYTIQPPYFYRALRGWNETHPDRPLRLIHGVWTEPPPGRKSEQYDDHRWSAGFRDEMRRVVDVVHGHAALAHRPGHASGMYDADVAPWVLAYIIGREWEPYSIQGYVRAHPRQTAFDGAYLTVRGGNAADVWLAQQCDFLAGYEMRVYNAQRPIAYTNWPTLDPLHHPTESTLAEEESLRRRRGEQLVEPAHEYDNDAIALDATKVHATRVFAAGTFAAYHAYPYYPDFMILDPRYGADSARGNYAAYLDELVRYHGHMPVLIAEYGVPSSRGVAHSQPQGWTHGGHSEREQALIDARLTRDIHASGAAGGVLFSIIDEWFKKNWTVIDFEQPADHKQRWLNVLDPEEQYGVIAMRPGATDSGIVIDGQTSDWRGRQPWYAHDAAGAATRAEQTISEPLRLRSFWVASDEAYVYLRLDVGRIDWNAAHYLIGIDSYRRDLGDTRLPYTGSVSPVGLEFVVDLHGPVGSHLLVDAPYDLYRHVPIRGSRTHALMSIYNRPFETKRNAAGRWDTLWLETNRPRIGRDGTVFNRVVTDRNLLRYAPQSDSTLSDWYADTLSGVIELRLPWGLLHVLDPSTRSVLFGATKGVEQLPAGRPTDGFRFIVESYDPRDPRGAHDHLPADDGRGGAAGSFGSVPTWAWPTWEQPRWHAAVKPLLAAMRSVFGAIDDARDETRR